MKSYDIFAMIKKCGLNQQLGNLILNNSKIII